MKNPIRFKLSFMMFLYYFSLGLVTPMLTQYLTSENHLGFSGTHAGLISGMQALAVILSPLLGAFITDRMVSAERLLALLQLAAGFILIAFPFVSSFPAVLILFSIYQILFIPCTALTNTITLHHSCDAGHLFGNVRKWGTIGWIVAGQGVFLVSLMVERFDYRFAFCAAGAAALLLGGFAFWGLKSDGQRELLYSSASASGGRGFLAGIKRFIPMEAFRILLKKEILIILLVSVAVKLVDKYYYFGCSPFLRYQGAQEQWIPAIMTLGQLSEVFVLMFLGRLISRYGFKKILLVGVGSELIRFLILMNSRSLGMTLFSFPFHGVAFAFIAGTATIYINRGTDRRSRAGVQHLYGLITGSVGNFLGAAIPGRMIGSASIEEFSGYTLFWMVPAGMAAAASLLVLLLKSAKQEQDRQVV